MSCFSVKMDLTSTDACREKKQVPFNIYHYDAHLAAAFQTDCEDLLQRFSNRRRFNFATFAALWKESCFISIFDEQDFLLMLQTFIENCFFVVKNFLFSTDPYIQTGAFYILYALYYKQPIREWVKIRLTQSEADKLNGITEFHKFNNHWEFVFIYSKMRLDGAFHYCTLPRPVGLDAKFLRRYDLTGEAVHKMGTLECPLKKFKTMSEDPALIELMETDKEYHNLATEYREKCKQLFVFPSEVGNELRNAYDCLFNASVNLPGEEITTNRQDKLSEIKARTMANVSATYRAEKAVVADVDLDEFEASSSK